MAFDGLYLHYVINELKSIIIDGRINKINQPEKDEIIFTIKTKNHGKVKLLISSSSSYPKIHITNEIKENPLTPPLFNMVLRKYLNNSKIIDIEQIKTDRIGKISFLTTDELGFDSKYNLYFEIMGRHSNITLVRDRDNVIMDSIKHVTEDINRFRTILPSLEFVLPPSTNKLDPFTFTKEDFEAIASTTDFNTAFASKVFMGIGKDISKDLYLKYNNEDLFSYIKNYFSISPEFNIYIENGVPFNFSSMPLSLDNSTFKNYSSPSLLIEDYYKKKDKADRLKNRTLTLQKLINNNIERCVKKEKILLKTLEETKDKDKFKLYGELLTSNIYAIKDGDKEANVYNYYTNDYITISLDPNKSVSYNIQKYYKKYNKLKKSEEMANIQLEHNKIELEYLTSVLTNINLIENYNEIDDIKNELITEGYIKFSKKKKKSTSTKPLKFISPDGIDIYVGKNNIQNDYLTTKFASKNDIWLHTKNIPGSHVIIKRTSSDIPNTTLEYAANLAAYYSKGRSGTKVPVDYTEIKNVRKPNGAKAGMVIYLTNKTIYIDPKPI